MSSGSNPALSLFVRGTTDTVHAFMLQSGLRRPIPDDVTWKILLAGQHVRTLSDADLGAIPLGATLPSRKDGTLMTQKFAVASTWRHVLSHDQRPATEGARCRNGPDPAA